MAASHREVALAALEEKLRHAEYRNESALEGNNGNRFYRSGMDLLTDLEPMRAEIAALKSEIREAALKDANAVQALAFNRESTSLKDCAIQNQATKPILLKLVLDTFEFIADAFTAWEGTFRGAEPHTYVVPEELIGFRRRAHQHVESIRNSLGIYRFAPRDLAICSASCLKVNEADTHLLLSHALFTQNAQVAIALADYRTACTQLLEALQMIGGGDDVAAAATYYTNRLTTMDAKCAELRLKDVQMGRTLSSFGSSTFRDDTMCEA